MNKESSPPFTQTRRFKGIVLLCIAVLLLLAAAFLKDVLTPVLVGFLLAYIFEPLLMVMEKMRIRRVFGVVLLYLLLFLTLILAGMWITPRLASQSARLYRNISGSTMRLGLGLPASEQEARERGELLTKEQGGGEAADSSTEDDSKSSEAGEQKSSGEGGWISETLGISIKDTRALLARNADKIANRIAELFTAVLQKTGRGISNAVGFVFNTLLVLVFAFFFMLRFKQIKAAIRRYIPAANRATTLRVIGKIDCAVSNFFRGRLLVCVIAGFVSSIGFLLSGIDYWLILGIAAGILGFIPIIGVIVALVPACAFAVLSTHPLGSLIGVAITFAVVQMVVEPLIGTFILSHEVKIHPILVIVALLIGGQLFGTFGMILSIPLAATVKILVEEFVIPPLKDLADEEGSYPEKSS
jgi:predicted PurR-regulated permease PerM